MENKIVVIPAWTGWRFDELQKKRKAAEEKAVAGAWNKASEIAHGVLAKLEESPGQQEITVRVDGLPDKAVNLVIKHLAEADWPFMFIKEDGLNNQFVFDLSQRPTSPDPEPGEEEEEEDAKIAKLAEEADAEDTLCGK